jgi:hypothetical protein
MTDSNAEEKRKAKRVQYLTEVECEGADYRRHTCRISDLSTTGAFVDSMLTYPPDSIVKLKFLLGSTEVQVSAQVCYSMPQIGMGVRFLDLTPEQLLAIETVVQGRSS